MLQQPVEIEQTDAHSLGVTGTTEAAEDQRKAIFNILEDVTDAQEILHQKLNQVQVLRDTLEHLTASILPQRVMDTVAKSINKIIPYYSLSYIIWQGEGLKFSNILYVYAKGSIGSQYISRIQHDLLGFIDNLSYKILNKSSLKNQVTKKMYPEFLTGFYNKNIDLMPESGLVVPFNLHSGENREDIYTMGMFHIASINPKEQPTEEEIKIINDIATISAVNIERIKNIAAVEQARLSSLLRSMSDGVILFDRSKNIILSNPAILKMLGLPEHDAQKINQQRVLFSEVEKILATDAFDISSKVSDIFEKGQESKVEEFDILSFTYEIFFIPVRDVSGDIIGGGIILHDITHIKEVDRMKTEFVSLASHQLRTPLTAIKLFIELLSKGDIGKLNKKQSEYIGDVATSTERMIRLVNDLLNVSRLESGRLKIEPVLTDLQKFVSSIIEESLPLCEEKECQIRFDKPKSKIGKIMIDKTLVRQIIHNLITNAIRYSRDKGQIVVGIEEKSREYVLIVSDDGIGIPNEAKPNIFQKFFRADNAQKAEAEGSGLGLYVVKMITEASGGRVWFESSPKTGTTFYVTIPKEGMKPREGEKSIAT